jgi:membrane-bound lytic murein transglycosylase B
LAAARWLGGGGARWSFGCTAKSTCKNTGSFDRWLANFKQQAVNAGISNRVVNAALSGVKFNPNIIKKDRAQVIFSDDWLTFAGKLVSASRLKTGLQNSSRMRACSTASKRHMACRVR